MSEERIEERVFPSITIPLPPTDNRLRMPTVRGRRPFLTLTPEYRNWKRDLELVWLQWAAENRDFKPYQVSAKFFLEFQYQIFLSSWSTDAQNYEKALRDGMEGLLFSSDRYVYIRAAGKPQIDKMNPRLVLDPNPLLLE